MAKLTIFGKDCARNRRIIRDNCAYLSHHLCCVGVESFKEVLEDMGVSVEYFPRKNDDPIDVCERLGKMLKCDEVIMLPVRGRMTEIEYRMAKELKKPIDYMNE